MALLDDDSEGFSFIWTIQNYNFWFRKGDEDFYASPTFMLGDGSGEKWCLNLYRERYPSHDNIGLALQRCVSDSLILSSYNRYLEVKISIRDHRGTFKKNLSNRLEFGTGPNKSRIIKLIINKEEMDDYFNNDSFTLKCQILNNRQNSLFRNNEPRECYVRTLIGVERINYSCTLEGIEEFERVANESKRLIIWSEVPYFGMYFFSTKENYAGKKIKVRIELSKSKEDCYCSCKISLVDIGGNIVQSVRDECDLVTSKCQKFWTFPVIEIRKILSNKHLYLKNGVLRLLCEFAVSSGEAHTKVDSTDCGNKNIFQLQCRKETTGSNLTKSLNDNLQPFYTESLQDNLQRFYLEGKFCDLTIRTPSKEFRVHKNILCSRSEVFSTMFERDMKENREGVVEIGDVNDETISKMLLFLYTDTIGEDLVFETASSLYFAADKYRIMGLKRKCSDFMKGHITKTNVCNVLVLADMHQDEELKSAAQKFIFENCGEIMESEEWKKFMKEESCLASYIMHTLLSR